MSGAAIGGSGFRGAPIGGGGAGFRSIAIAPGGGMVRGGPFVGGGFVGHGFRHHGFHRRFFPGFAVGFGPYAYYDDYPYYYDDYSCYIVKQRVLTRYGWRLRRVQVCE